MPIAIIVHGGAGNIAPDRHSLVQAGCKEATLIGWRVLNDGGSSLDAVEAAVRALEDNPHFNAGTGSCLTAEGKIEMDAGLMDGHSLQVGAVTAVELIKNPIVLARKVLESPHVLLTGRGAQLFAQEHALPLCRFEDLLTERQYNRWQQLHSVSEEKKHGTVGAVALDTLGNLASATSTGGVHYKYPGRVGDSPLVGCGFYADDNAAISCTGQGEDFVRLLLAKRTADFVARGSRAREAAEAAIAVLGAKASGTGGLIVIDRYGNIGFSRNSEYMVYAYMSSGQQTPVSGV